MAALFDINTNYSFYAVPAAWVVAVLPHVYTLVVAKSVDRTVPRSFAQAIENDQTLDKATKGKVVRSESAQANGFENIGLFASAVVAGNVAGLPAQTLNLLSGGYIASRLVYNWLYMNTTNQSLAPLRTAVFFVGLGQIFALFVQSGNILKDRLV